MKLRKANKNESYAITIPKDIVKKLGWHVGDNITYDYVRGSKEITLYKEDEDVSRL